MGGSVAATRVKEVTRRKTRFLQDMLKFTDIVPASMIRDDYVKQIGLPEGTSIGRLMKHRIWIPKGDLRREDSYLPWKFYPSLDNYRIFAAAGFVVIVVEYWSGQWPDLPKRP